MDRDVKNLLRNLFRLEAVVLAVLVGGIIFYPAEKAAYFQLYELLGAVIAVMITTFGLRKMKGLTEN